VGVPEAAPALAHTANEHHAEAPFAGPITPLNADPVSPENPGPIAPESAKDIKPEPQAAAAEKINKVVKESEKSTKAVSEKSV